MVTQPGLSNKKELNFDLNLMPVIDILSVCICFLLITVVWTNVGSLNVSQGVGTEATGSADNTPAVWVYLKQGGQVVMSVRNLNKKTNQHDTSFSGNRNGGIKWSSVESFIGHLKEKAPDLRTALIMPSKQISYEDIIKMMDRFKKSGIEDVGISPL